MFPFTIKWIKTAEPIRSSEYNKPAILDMIKQFLCCAFFLSQSIICIWSFFKNKTFTYKVLCKTIRDFTLFSKVSYFINGWIKKQGKRH